MRIYLDHAATTPVLPEVAESMAPWQVERFGNPSSLYQEGRSARAAVDEAREIVSQALGCEFGEVIFTSSGTEAANLAVLGAALANTDARRNKVLFSAAEHHCVLHAAPVLEKLGYRVALIPVDRYARVDVDRLGDLVDDQTLLVSAMHANNELGTVNPVEQVGALAHQAGALFCCDAVQTFMSRPVSPQATGADLIIMSAHKINGPKGAGGLYIKGGTKLQPLSLGGGQEREMRAGTENVAAIVGFGAAVKARQGRSFNGTQTARDAFVERLTSLHVPGVEWTVPSGIESLPSHAHLRVKGIAAESMLIRLDRMGVSASSGAACSSGSIEPSHVLLACGYSEAEAREGLRFTFGISSSPEEAVQAAEIVAGCVHAIATAS